MVVWTAPGIPKAFAENTFLAGVLSTLRSWTHLGDGGRQSSNGSGQANVAAWAQPSGGSSGRARKRTATELDLMWTQNADDLEAGSDHPRGAGQQVYTAENGIWKTTVLETQEGSSSKISADQAVERQHPWMDERKW